MSGAGPVVFLDLDRTTTYSTAALDLRGPDHLAPRLLCVEVHRGIPRSFLTEAAATTFRELQAVATLQVCLCRVERERSCSRRSR